MAHFQQPPDGDLGEYDADNKLAVGSLWRMSVPLGGTGAEVALWGGQGLTVRSNNENAVANPLPERTSGGLRIFRIRGLKLNDGAMIEFGVGGVRGGGWQWNGGAPWPGSLQVRVTATAKVTPTAVADALLTLGNPSLALNAAGIPYLYDMQHSATIPASAPSSQIISRINAAGRLKHLVFNCHGYINYANNTITGSRIALGSGFSDPALFGQLRFVSGGVIWLAGCVIGNDNVRNIERAKNARCYVVSPMTSMQLKPGLLAGGSNHLPSGKLDMFARFAPKVFTPGGGLMAFSTFLGMGGQLGFTV